MPSDTNRSLREHLLYLLNDGGAHAKFDDVVKDLPPKLRAKKPPNLPHSPWMLLEHIRLAQWDILDFTRNPEYAAPEWPAGYWPKTAAPPNDAAWNKSIQKFRKDLKAMAGLVKDPETDLLAPIPWGDGQTILREVLLVADHNAYHLGQFVDARRLLGAWKE
jgi:DinB superfamily